MFFYMCIFLFKQNQDLTVHLVGFKYDSTPTRTLKKKKKNYKLITNNKPPISKRSQRVSGFCCTRVPKVFTVCHDLNKKIVHYFV